MTTTRDSRYDTYCLNAAAADAAENDSSLLDAPLERRDAEAIYYLEQGYAEHLYDCDCAEEVK